MRILIVPLILGLLGVHAFAAELDDAKHKYFEARRAAAKELYDAYKKELADAQQNGSNDKAEQIEKEMKGFVARERAVLKADVAPDKPAAITPIKEEAVKGATNARNIAKLNLPGAKTISKGTQKFTDSGHVKLTKDEIDLFIAKCRADKPQILKGLQQQINNHSTTENASEIVDLIALFKFLSQDNVLIAPRGPEGNALFFKPNGSLTCDYASAKTLQIIDRRSALVELGWMGGREILEGIETSKISTGEWQFQFMLKHAGKKEIAGIIGKTEVDVYQAVSLEGFPKDVTIW